MARKQTVSDEEVIATAKLVLKETGAQQFSLSAVAKKLSISRAALILRFDTTDNLLTLASRANFEKFKTHFDSLQLTNDIKSLTMFCRQFAGLVTTKRGASRYLEQFSARAKNKQLEALDFERGEFIQGLIRQALPKTLLTQPDAVRLFNNFLTGTVIEWIANDATDSVAFFNQRCTQWLALCGQLSEAER